MLQILPLPCIMLAVASQCYEFNVSSPMPPFVMSRKANLTKPRLVITHATEYADFIGVAIPLGFQMAIEDLANVTPFLQNYEIQVNLYESYCSDDIVIKESMDIMRMEKATNNLPIHTILGCAAKSQKLVGEVAHHFNYTAIAVIDTVPQSYIERSRFRNFYTLGESVTTIQHSVLAFIQEQGWNRVALVGEDFTYYLPWAQALIKEAQLMKIDLILYEQVPYNWSYTEDGYGRAIESLAGADPRVIVFQGDFGYTFICWLHRFQLFGPNYAIFIERYADTNTNRITIPEFLSSWCTVDMVREVLNLSFVYGESNRADLFKDIPDDAGRTWHKWENEIRSRVFDVDNAVFLYESAKYFYYDLMLFIGFMLNEAERILNEQKDTLLNWSIDTQNFKRNGRYINKIFQKAMQNIRVVGLRGTYQFKDSLNTGGYTPLNIFQVIIQQGSMVINQRNVAFYESSKPVEERLDMINGSILWNTPDGKAPFDRIQIKTIDIPMFRLEGMVIWMVLTAGLCLSMITFLIMKTQSRSFGNILLICGSIICNCHIFLLLLRDVEPVAFHCSLLGALVMAGISTCFLGMFVNIDWQFKELQHSNAFLRSKPTSRPKLKRSKLDKILIVLLQLAIILSSLLFLFSKPVESRKKQVTDEDTFGRREALLSTSRSCHLDLNPFTTFVIACSSGLVLFLVLKTALNNYNGHILRKKLENTQKNRNAKDSYKNIHGNVFIITVTIFVGACLIVFMVDQQSFYVTAVTSNLFAIATIFVLVFTCKTQTIYFDNNVQALGSSRWLSMKRISTGPVLSQKCDP